jgi:hypothetical protein
VGKPPELSVKRWKKLQKQEESEMRRSEKTAYNLVERAKRVCFALRNGGRFRVNSDSDGLTMGKRLTDFSSNLQFHSAKRETG